MVPTPSCPSKPIASSFVPLHMPTRGVIRPRAHRTPFDVTLWQCQGPLSAYIDRAWRVRWSLDPGDEHTQFTLPDPVLHMVFEAGEANVQGPLSHRFERRLVGSGEVLGFRFRAGAYRSLHAHPVVQLLDTRTELVDLFGPPGTELASSIPTLSQTARLDAVSTWLLDRLPAKITAKITDIRDCVERTVEDRSITRIGQMAALVGVSTRTLQRRFDDIVGWTPQAVIRRRRVHDALTRLDASPSDLGLLAAELGYADQAHFCRDFKAMTRMTPTAYLAPTAPSQSDRSGPQSPTRRPAGR